MVKILFWINIVVIFLGFGAYLSPYVSPENFWMFSILGLFYPWLVLANIIFVLIWTALGKRYFIYPLAWLILGMGQFTSLVGFRTKPNFPETETELRVMTFNCRNLIKPGENSDQGTDRLTEEEITGLINDYGLDIICFQEFPLPKVAGQFADMITNGTDCKHYFQDQGGQLAIFSKYPISKKRAKYYANRSNGYLSSDITVGDKVYRLFNIHLQSNAVSKIADKVASEGKIQEKETWLTIRGMIGKYRNSARKRSVQAREIAEHIQRSPNPVIICGDFNDVPQSNAYHLLSRGTTDTFKKAGVGIGTTYAGSIPGLRIDYILESANMKTLEFDILKVDYSDHYPVFARLQPQ